MAAVTTLYDQTTELTLKTKPGEPACTTSITGMTPAVEAAAVALINGFNTNLETVLATIALHGTISEPDALLLSDLSGQVETDTSLLAQLVLDNG